MPTAFSASPANWADYLESLADISFGFHNETEQFTTESDKKKLREENDEENKQSEVRIH